MMIFCKRSLPLAALPVLVLLSSVGCTSSPGGRPRRRAKTHVFIMGFDGMDPTLARKLMDEGKLPHLKALSETGTFAKLETTQPSESPVAWSSFATGVNPGKHNIFDFIVRDFQTYMPDVGMVRKEPPQFLWGMIPTKPPKATSIRGGTSFWIHAGQDGVGSEVLTVPVTFPPEEIAHGTMLSGLGVPDMRGTWGTYYYWATDLPSFEEGNSEMLGLLKPLLFENGVAQTFLKGPENPLLKQEERELLAKKKGDSLSDKEKERLQELAAPKDINVPISLKWIEGSGKVGVDVQGQEFSLKAGEWSDWVSLTFKINLLVSLHGITKFYAVKADQDLRLYALPVNLDPRNPPLPISKPNGFTAQMTKEIGLFRTIGWAEAADKALNEERLDEAAFLYDAQRAFEDREKIIFKRLEDRKDWDLFVAVIETTDRISHMMWRLIDPKHPMYDAKLAATYGDSIEKIYRRADDLVGRLQAHLPPDTIFMVLSDHGFHSFRRSVNLNTWLVQNGYMVFTGQEGVQKTIADLQGRGKFWEGVDWSKTRAYAVGLGQIYFNLRGREGRGIVSSGAEYTQLQDEIAAKLVTLADPDTGEKVFHALYKRDDIYKGEFLRNAPDLQVGFNDGYRVGWQDTLGQIQRTVVQNNNRKWSGDHCATATEISGGVLFCSRKINTTSPNIMDIAPTVLKILEVPLPGDLDGKPFM
jgi:predicted AlkP superfamily phosphohydrolase/phosphomutase